MKHMISMPDWASSTISQKMIGVYGHAIGHKGHVSLNGTHYANSICIPSGSVSYHVASRAIRVTLGIDDNYPGDGVALISVNGMVRQAAALKSGDQPRVLQATMYRPGIVSIKLQNANLGTRLVIADAICGDECEFPLGVFAAQESVYNHHMECSMAELFSAFTYESQTYSIDVSVTSVGKTLWDFLRQDCGATIDELNSLDFDCGTISSKNPELNVISLPAKNFFLTLNYIQQKLAKSSEWLQHKHSQKRLLALIFAAQVEVNKWF